MKILGDKQSKTMVQPLARNDGEYLLELCNRFEEAEKVTDKCKRLIANTVLSGKGESPREMEIPTSFSNLFSSLERKFWTEHDFCGVYEVAQSGDRTWLLGDYRGSNNQFLFSLPTKHIRWKIKK